ncbi:hypothetical protein ACH4LT_24800 [Streptomyces clavifer]|uniref:hypothetical protein n=1 Tax=Streptomyces clavifer TaxID=68188 RepID=UPI00378B8EB3
MVDTGQEKRPSVATWARRTTAVKPPLLPPIGSVPPFPSWTGLDDLPASRAAA